MQISDEELVQRCKDGDREAFNTLIKRYQHAVYGLCYHFAGDFADAQDLTQETFVRVYLNLHQIQNVSKFPAWIRQIATNVCQRWLIPIVDSKAPVFWNQTDVSTAFLWFMNVKTPRVNQLSPSKPKTPSSFSQNGLSTSVIADSIEVNVSKTLFPI